MTSKNNSSWHELYPFESHEIKIDSHRYHYVDEGQGAPVLMVHGNPTWSFYWRNLIKGLSGSHRTIAVDHIGCGLSDKPADYSYCLAQHIDNLSELVERLDLSEITLVVHDWGGAIGLGTALRMPERFSRLVLFNTAAFPPPFIPLRINACRIPVLGTLAIRGLNAFAGLATTMAVEKRGSLSAAEKAGLVAPYDSWANRIATDRFVKDIPATPRHPTWQVLEEIEKGLPTLADRPVQMIWGMRDWCFQPVCLERLLKSFPDAEVHRLEEVGHYVVEEGRDQVIPLVKEFLSSTCSTLSAKQA